MTTFHKPAAPMPTTDSSESTRRIARRAPAPAGQHPPHDPPHGGYRRRSELIMRRAQPYFYVAPTVVLLFVLLVVPVVLVIGYSFMDNVIMNKNPQSVGLANYVTVLTDTNFHRAVTNTLFFTIVSVIAHLVLGLLFASLLNSPLLGRTSMTLFRMVYVLPWLFTTAVIAILWRMLLNPNGVINYLLGTNIEWLSDLNLALPAVTFINVWAGYPFFMISLLAGLQGVPADLYEAAKIDGASFWQRFTNVTLPQLKPIIISMTLLDLIWTSQQFALIWMTTGGGPINVTEMLSTYTYKQAFSNYEFALASTAAVITLVLSMILGILYVRHQKARD
ncbi:carbohydrate ABC transporter permease [Populibacterium corticicola]